MALNANIPLQAQGLNLEPPVNALQRAMSMAGLRDQNALRQMQMQQMQAAAQQSMAEKQAAAQRQAQMDAALQQLQPVRGVDANRASGIVGPRPGAAAAIGQRPQADPIALLRAGFDPKMVEFIVNSPNLGRAEVARVLERAGANGRPESVQLDKFGQPVGSALPKAVEAKVMDLGGTKQAYDPYALKPGQNFQTTMTPEGRDASARGWAGVKLQRDRLAFDQGTATADAGGPQQAALVKQFGKPPADRRWRADGTLEVIPGSKSDSETKVSMTQAADKARQAAATIDQMLAHPGLDTAIGASGQLDPRNYIWGTDAQGARALIDQAQGQAFLQAFESLKGGGAITQVEGDKATAAIARLQRAQSEDDFKAAAAELRQISASAYKRATGQDLPTPKLDTKLGVPADISDIMKKYGK